MTLKNKNKRNQEKASSGLSRDDIEDVLFGSIEDGRGNNKPKVDSQQEKYTEVGKALKDAREIKGVTIEDIAKSLKVREECILLIEEGKQEEVSRITYYYGCVRSMVKYLNLPEDMVYYLDPHYDKIKNDSNAEKHKFEGDMNQSVFGEKRKNNFAKRNLIIFCAAAILLLALGKMLSKRSNDEKAFERSFLDNND